MSTRDAVAWCDRCEDDFDFEYDVQEVIDPMTGEGFADTKCPVCDNETMQFVTTYDPDAEEEQEWERATGR